MKKGTCSSMPLSKKMNQLLRRIDKCSLSVKVYQRDVKIQFSPLNLPKFTKDAQRRPKIVKFSKRSARRLRFVIRNSENLWKAFVTLTYPENFPSNGRQTKKHLNAFLQYLRRKDIKFTWVLEFQSRGAPHYHIIVSGFISKDELSRIWYRIVGSGDEKHLKAGTGIEAIKSKGHLYGYLSNYIKKLDQKTPPEGFENVGRFWGASRNLLTFQLYQKINHYYKLSRMIKLIRRWYKAHLRQFGIKWKWRGQGFTALDGVLLIRHLMALRWQNV
jgi:hypothetical protein